MLFSYEIAFEKGGARFVEAMKDKFLREALVLVVRRSPGHAPDAVRALHRVSPTPARLQAAGLAAESPHLTGWALREFGDVDEAVPCHG